MRTSSRATAPASIDFATTYSGASTASRKPPAGRRVSARFRRTGFGSLARRMSASRTFINVNWSLQRGDHGEQPIWAAIALAATLGQVGLPGGGVGFGYGSMEGVASLLPNLPIPTLSVGRNPVRSFIPVARIADLLLNPGSAVPVQRPRSRLSGYTAGLLVRRQSVSSSPGSSTG